MSDFKNPGNVDYPNGHKDGRKVKLKSQQQRDPDEGDKATLVRKGYRKNS